MVQKIAEGKEGNEPKLSSQYVSTIEVGGAYAQKFYPLLNFLGLRTLVITDIDTVGQDGKKCKVSDGVKTSNSCITDWFDEDGLTAQSILGKSDEEKVHDFIRIAYQTPQDPNTDCGRSFEDEFMLENLEIFLMLKLEPL